MAEWRKRNHAHVSEYRKAYETGRGRVVMAVWRAKRLAIARSLPASFSERQWQRCIEYFDYRCAACGRPRGLWHTLAQDHWIALADPRPDNPGTVPANIVPLCHGIDGCNNKKNNRDAAEWLVGQFGQREARKILDRVNAYFDWVRQQGE